MILFALVLVFAAAILLGIDLARSHALATAAWLLLAIAWALVLNAQYHVT